MSKCIRRLEPIDFATFDRNDGVCDRCADTPTDENAQKPAQEPRSATIAPKDEEAGGGNEAEVLYAEV